MVLSNDHYSLGFTVENYQNPSQHGANRNLALLVTKYTSDEDLKSNDQHD